MFECLCAGPLSSTATSSVSSTTTSSVSTSTTTSHCCDSTTATSAVHCYSSNNRQVRLNLCKMFLHIFLANRRPQAYETLIFVCRTYCVCSSSTATNSCYRGEDSGERETPGNKLSLTIEEVKFELQMGFGTGLAMAAGVMIGEAIADGQHHHHHHHGRHHQHHRHGHHHHHHGRHHH